MSLLEQLRSKRKSLKPTETVVTQIDGQRFLQCKDEMTGLPNNEYGYVVDTKPDDVPAKIIEHLYLGSQDCCQLHVLKNYNILNVLSVGIDAPEKFDGFHYKFVECLDLPETKIDAVLRDCIPLIESSVKQNSNILIHCNAGVSRSASIVIGFLMLVHKYTFSEAFSVVKAARSCIRPNNGFLDQLKNLSD